MSALESTAPTMQHADTTSSATPQVRENKPAEDNSLLAKGKAVLGLGKKKKGGVEDVCAHICNHTAAVATSHGSQDVAPRKPTHPSRGHRRIA
jgi:hypothetical protein